MGGINRKLEKNKKEYIAWSNMLSRCRNKNNPRYSDYGGRGITVCTRWLFFDNFLEDMGVCSNPDLTLDRIDNNLGYTKENCVWNTRSKQQRNQRLRNTNTSGYKGVWYRKNRDRWIAECLEKYLGSYKTKEEASAAYASYFSSINT